jgi:SnoaL-like polyketide cyclase
MLPAPHTINAWFDSVRSARHRRHGGGSGHGRRPLDDPRHPARSIGSHPPTGKQVEFAGVNIFRLASGKIVEIWNHRDDLRLYQQLGDRDDLWLYQQLGVSPSQPQSHSQT